MIFKKVALTSWLLTASTALAAECKGQYTFLAEAGEAFPQEEMVEVTVYVTAERVQTTPALRGEPETSGEKLFCFEEQFSDGKVRGDVWVEVPK